MTQVLITDISDANILGAGAFDTLMRAHKAHLLEEFNSGRIRGPEYATVYLGALEATMRSALEFTMARQRVALEAELMAQQVINAGLEAKVLVAQECKLRAEYDLTMKTTEKAGSENALLLQKVTTEKAQTQSIGIDPNSVIGKQKILYQAQADGFVRDSEQKVAKIMIDTWQARRMTDEGTSANGINKLDDTIVGRTVDKMMSGINA